MIKSWYLKLATTALAAATTVPVFAQVVLPEPVYQVRMSASYDPEDQQIQGVERMRWKNTSSVPVTELQFHLYLNAFANNRSTFMTESGGQLRGVEMSDMRWGWSEVRSMRLAYGADIEATGEPAAGDTTDPVRGGFTPWVDGEPEPLDLDSRPDLKVVEEFIQPDDGNKDDRTVASYQLPRPVAPGEWVELEIEFASQMPEIFARTGAHGDYVLGGQWFPKIGVFEDAGDRGRAEAGWNTHQFHAHSEFFADFGDWEVELELPARYAGRIGATGRLVDESVDSDTVTARFVQPGVHDFAWTADSDFLVVEDRFDPVADVPREQLERIAELLGVGPEELLLQAVDIRLMLQPAHRSQAGRYIEAAKAALRGYGLRLGAYPWKTLTVVDPPRGGMGSAGMEYPTFITAGTHPAMEVPGFTMVRMPELVTVHELGHNFFQGMIASNEFEEAWIDEGINSYYEMVVMEEAYGAMIELFGARLSPEDGNINQLGAGRYTDAIMQPSWSYRSSHSYSLNSYARPAVTLRHLENLLGEERFHRAMRHFFQTWRFRHPTTADFEAAISLSTGEDLDWFFDQALHSDRSLDYRVRSATSTSHKQASGWFGDDDERSLLGERPRHGGHGDDHDGEDHPEDDSDDEASDDMDEDDGMYRTEVVVERRGEFVHPVTVELVFEDGEKLRHPWDGRDRWVRFIEVRPSKLAWAVVDPDREMTLDVDVLNNSRRLDPDPAPAAKMLAHMMFWLQNFFELTAILG